MCALHHHRPVSHLPAGRRLWTPENPVTISAPATGSGPLEVSLNQGWTWFSTNRTEADPSIDAVLDGLFAYDSDIIKDLTQFSLYDEGSDGWVGLITEVGPTTTYKIRLTEANTLLLPGTPVNVATTDVAVTQGWTWIPYLPQETYPLGHALQGFNAQDNDVIKDQESFAQHFGGIWFGSLQEMRPGGGYLLKASQAGSFRYPAAPPAGATAKVADRTGQDEEERASAHYVKAERTKEIVTANAARTATSVPDWAVEAAAFEHSMSVVARLEVDGVPLADPDALLAAFVGDEVRGVGRPQHIAALGQHLTFLTVHSNMAQGELVTLQFYDSAQDAIYETSMTLTFEANAVVGSVGEPLVVAAAATGTAIGAGLDLPADYALDQNYPNPFNPETTIRYALPEAAQVELVVFDVTGREVVRLNDHEQQAGRYAVRFDARSLPSGVYFYRLRAGSFSAVQKMVLLK